MKFRKLMITISMIVFSCVSNAENLKPTLADRNDFWNRYITYMEEPNGEDNWQSPEETWQKRTGDCEDYAIVKYFDLISSGIEKSKLSLAWVILDDKFIAKQKYQSHVVLFYENNGEKWVLDNYANNIVPLKDRKDIILVNAIMNQDGVTVQYGKSEKITQKWNKINKNFNNHVLFMASLQQNLELAILGTPQEKKS